MSRIKVLPEDVVTKIAAGEVIERPASIVKELIENSLDAGADRIKLRIKGGGIELIEVSDNGMGMTEEEVKTAFMRHATSKIHDMEDLEKVSTLGFRGEALPSIAAVSKVTVLTKSDESSYAVSYKISGGANIDAVPATRDKGTTFTVKDLFFNLPARKKFLKTELTERKNIITVLESLALSRPDVSFQLQNEDGRDQSFSPGNIKRRFGDISGKSVADKLLDIDFKNPFISLNGIITDPSINFSSRNRIYLYVNGRPVYPPVVVHALDQGYRSYLPPKRFPACVLNIGISSQLIDVNVHPAKREVRFTNPQGVFQIISKVLNEVLSNSPVAIDTENDSLNSVPQQKTSRPSSNSNAVRKVSSRLPEKQSDYLKEIDLSKATEFTFKPVSELKPETERNDRIKGSLRPHFQWKYKYIIAEDEDSILIIDQHTAWERINYEKLQKEFSESEVSSQGLLLPELLEFEPSRSDILSGIIAELKDFGIFIEDFGPNTFKLKAVPAPAGNVKDRSSIKDMIEEILDLYDKKGNFPSRDEINDEIIKIIACRSSIKAGDKLNGEEIKAMIALLNKCEVPHRCPHGRPVIIRFSEKRVDRDFMR